jgi:hypothetical protein
LSFSVLYMIGRKVKSFSGRRKKGHAEIALPF